MKERYMFELIKYSNNIIIYKIILVFYNVCIWFIKIIYMINKNKSRI